MKKYIFILLLTFISNWSFAEAFKTTLINSYARIIISGTQSKNVDPEDAIRNFVIDVDIESIIAGFRSGHASFSSPLEYNSFMYKFNKLEQEEQERLLSGLSYLSFEKYADQLIDSIVGIESRSGLLRYVEDHGEILEIILDDDGEEELRTVLNSEHMIAPFLNQDRIIQVGELFLKFMDDQCIYANNYDELLAIRSADDIRNTRLTHEKVYFEREVEKDVDIELEPRDLENDLWNPIYFTENNDAFWCKNKRKVTFKAVFAASSYFSLNIEGESHLFAYLEARETIVPKRKGILCIWYNYKTEITWNNDFAKYTIKKVSNPAQSFSKSGTNLTKEARYLKWARPIGSYNNNNWPYCHWDEIQADVTTRGIQPKWLQVRYEN